MHATARLLRGRLHALERVRVDLCLVQGMRALPPFFWPSEQGALPVGGPPDGLILGHDQRPNPTAGLQARRSSVRRRERRRGGSRNGRPRSSGLRTEQENENQSDQTEYPA